MLVHDVAASTSELLADEHIETGPAVVALRAQAAAPGDERLGDEAAFAAVGDADAVRHEPADVADVGGERVVVELGQAVVAEDESDEVSRQRLDWDRLAVFPGDDEPRVARRLGRRVAAHAVRAAHAELLGAD